MYRMTTTPLLLVLAITAPAAPAAPPAAGDAHWRAYVCRVTDWDDCTREQSGSRVYPDPAVYPDRDSCLTGFGQQFENNPALKAKYPQTSDPGQSFVFDCEAIP